MQPNTKKQVLSLSGAVDTFLPPIEEHCTRCERLMRASLLQSRCPASLQPPKKS
jgi:hypothetical protein